MMENKKLFRTIRSESQLRNLLESLSLTDNIQSLHTIFSTLGYYILCNPQHSEIVIKFKPLYDKILLVLNQGPSPKTRLTLTLIASLILAESGTNRSKTETLRMYAQNMIRISGCLSALCHLFTNSMLQHETWTTLCKALSEACHKSVLNQNYCSHLIPLCIERCRRSNTEVLLVLHSLLVDHHTNIKVFYESDGMSIFTRETLLQTSYLCTLNTVIEGTKPSHREYVMNSNSIFHCLRRWVLTDESGSAVTKWAVVVLYSRRKLLGADDKLCDEPMNHENDNKNNSNLVAIQNDSTTEDKEEFVENADSETQDLFRNVMKEVYDWKEQSQRKGIPHIPLRPEESVLNNNMTKLLKRSFKTNFDRTNHSFLNLRIGDLSKRESAFFKCGENKLNNNKSNLLTTSIKKKHQSFLNLRKNTFGKPERPLYKCDKPKPVRDLSFSFLLKDNTDDQTKPESSTYTVKSSKHPPDRRERSRLTHDSYRSKLSRIAINSQRETNMNKRKIETLSNDTFVGTTCTLNDDPSTVFEFRPKRFSTPEQKSRKFTPRNETLNKHVRSKRHSPKCVKNLSVTSKFMDIINGSCTTLVKGLSKIKNVFVSKTTEDKNTDNVDDTNVRDCSYSFTNYMRERDARNDANTGFREKTNCSTTSSQSACQTCNNTIVLKRKLLENSSLRECVKKLKLGINLYGCDFKKISRVLWPREPYMTPEVLYSLYRKLIAK